MVASEEQDCCLECVETGVELEDSCGDRGVEGGSVGEVLLSAVGGVDMLIESSGSDSGRLRSVCGAL